MLIGSCNGCAAARFVYANAPGGSTVANWETIAGIIGGYNFSGQAFGTVTQINFALSGSSVVQSGSSNSAIGNFAAGAPLGVAGSSATPITSPAFSYFIDWQTSGQATWAHGQMQLTGGGAWNLQSPPWVWSNEAAGFAIPYPGANCGYSSGCVDGPGELACVDETTSAECGIIDVPLPAWDQYITGNNVYGTGASYDFPSLFASVYTWNLLYSYLTIGSLCDDPP